MEIRDLFVSQLRSLVPIAMEEGTLEELTDNRLKSWAVEICKDVFDKERDKPHSGEHSPIAKGDGKND